MHNETTLRKAYETSKYVPDILNVIVDSCANNIPLNHYELASRLNISKSNLSNIVSRLKSYDILKIEKQGLNKYYSLTKLGFELYRYSININKNQGFIDELENIRNILSSINIEASKSIEDAINILKSDDIKNNKNTKYQYLKYGNSIFRYPASQDNKGYGNIGEKYLKDQNKWVISYTATMIKNDGLDAIEISEEEMKSLINN